MISSWILPQKKKPNSLLLIWIGVMWTKISLNGVLQLRKMQPQKTGNQNRHTEEVEAESISYAVCKYFGIETGENSFGYIASWSQGKELKELRASLETINKTSGTLISDIERHYKEICKERGIDPHAKAEPETAPIEQPTSNLTYYVAECMEFPNLGEYHDNLSLEESNPHLSGDSGRTNERDQGHWF